MIARAACHRLTAPERLRPAGRTDLPVIRRWLRWLHQSTMSRYIHLHVRPRHRKAPESFTEYSRVRYANNARSNVIGSSRAPTVPDPARSACQPRSLPGNDVVDFLSGSCSSASGIMRICCARTTSTSSLCTRRLQTKRLPVRTVQV